MIKNFTLSVFLVLLFHSISIAQTCPEGDVLLSTQADIDSFPANYPGCTTLPGNLVIKASNADFRRLGALRQIIVIEGDLIIEDNAFVSRLDGLQNLRTIGGDFNVNSNNSIDDFDEMVNLRTIGGDFIVEYNSDIRNFDGFERLVSIGGDFRMRYNTSLTSIEGLNSITTIGGSINFQNLSRLVSLSGLENVDPTELNSLTIKNCKRLEVCNIESVCAFLDTALPVEIENNATGCDNTSEVATACGTTSTIDILNNNSLVLAPNPTQDIFRVNINSNEAYHYIVSNIIGKKLIESLIYDGGAVDLSSFDSGIYLFSLLTGDKRIVRRIIKK